MDAFALFEDGHTEKIEAYRELPTGEVYFCIGPDEYRYTEFIFSMVDGHRYSKYKFYKVCNDNTQMIAAPIKLITVPTATLYADNGGEI